MADLDRRTDKENVVYLHKWSTTQKKKITPS